MQFSLAVFSAVLSVVLLYWGHSEGSLQVCWNQFISKNIKQVSIVDDGDDDVR